MTTLDERKTTAWMMTEPGKPLTETRLPAPTLGRGEVLVEVAGCGVCHTDISFLHMGVKTRAPLPLVLGHEVSGVVREIGAGVSSELVGRAVLVPAVLPCGECDLCRAGHRTICRAQVMPGNDRHGGFATHMAVPSRYVCPVGDDVLATHELWELAVVSDAVSTPFMAVKRAGLAEGELAIVVGVGGIGVHAVQIAAATGAKVIALDVDPAKLELAASSGAAAVIDVRGRSVRDVKSAVKAEARGLGAPAHRWKVFETSGTGAGQEAAFALLGFGSTLAVIGFTMAKLELRLSNLMAFDAQVLGNWGCDPTLYPEILDWIAAGRIRVSPYVERFPLSEANAILDRAHDGELPKRAVLVP